jgi:transposase
LDFEKEILRLNGMVTQLLQKVTTLEAENTALKAENKAWKAENAILKLEVKTLKTKLNQNSNNSSWPPSSDLIKKTALPRNKGGKLGGKEGHKGDTLKMVETPDEMITDTPEQCKNCGKSLIESTIQVSEEKRQVFDIAIQPVRVLEYKYAVAHCSCGCVNRGEFPASVNQPTQYGPQIKALWTILNNECKLPYEKISQLSSDIFGISATASTIMNTQEQCYEGLEKVTAHIKKEVTSAAIAHFDESGARTAGKNAWVHVASNSRFTHIFAHENRGQKALCSEDSILPDFKGRAIHDCWASYFKFDCTHGLCAAHLLRELTALIEGGSQWASNMHRLLLDAYENRERGTGVVSNFEKLQRQYLKICNQADKEEVHGVRKGKAGRVKQSKGRNLLNRLLQHQEWVLAFAKYKEVPFTNNLAERDIRNIKIKIKVATSFRTFKGLKIYTRTQGFISTLKKHRLNVFSNLKAIFEGSFSLASFEVG